MARAAASGLSSVILCPPNISGAYSPYLLRLVETIRQGQFALVEDGSLPCNFVDVENLAHAIECGLATKNATAERRFVTDGETTWKQVARELATLADHEGPFPTIGREEALARFGPRPAARGSILRSLKHLVSADVNTALRQDPYLERVDDLLRLPYKALGKEFKGRLKTWLRSPGRIPKVTSGPSYEGTVVMTQLRGVAHSSDRARAEIGYDPPLDPAASMELFRQWYARTHGFGSESWELTRTLLRAG